MDPQELISSRSLTKSTKEEGIPLADPSSYTDYGSPSSNTTLTVTTTGDTLRSRSGYYDHLKDVTEEENTAEENKDPNHD